MASAYSSALSLESLPVELLYEIQLLALSEHLPHASRHLHQVYKLAPNSFHAQYILGRFYAHRSSKLIVTRSLRYPLCTQEVLEVILRHPQCPPIEGIPDLPKRFFRVLKPRIRAWDGDDAPLPFLRYLYNHSRFLPPDANSHDGYALTKAVCANFVPLVRFLLHHDASPTCKDNLSITIAIQQKNLSMVRLLIERGYGEGNMKKKRRLDDRVPSTVAMLKRAVKCGATDIIKYFRHEKDIVPDMQTIRLLNGSTWGT